MPLGNLPLKPDVADTAPTDDALTPYDIEHFVTYARLLDADNEHADWREVSRIVLHIDPETEPLRAMYEFAMQRLPTRSATVDHSARRAPVQLRRPGGRSRHAGERGHATRHSW
jgi:hypothetical protein